MKTWLPTLALLFLTTSFALAQQPAPDNGDVVKISTALIQIDVSATDKNGKVVSDLRQDEIEIFENGKRQNITYFDYVADNRESTETAKRSRAQSASVPQPLRPAQIRRTIALVVDDLSLSSESIYGVRRALRKFVDEQMVDGDLVAIVRTGSGTGALQQFTTDRRRLHAAIENVKWNPRGTGGISSMPQLEEKPPQAWPTPEPTPGETAAGVRVPENLNREINDFRTSLLAAGTLGTIDHVVRGMSDLPGRKSILLLSDGFRIFTREATGGTASGRVAELLRRLVDRANRGSVVIYTMDARAIPPAGFTAAEDIGDRTQTEILKAGVERRDDLRDTRGGLRFLALETGGIPFTNNNDLSSSVRRILDDQSFYLVAYEPDSAAFDPKTERFNRLEVRVNRPGVRVRYRSGFFGVPGTRDAAVKETGDRKLTAALTSPFAVNELSIRLNALFGSTPPQGPFIRSLVHISAGDLTFVDDSNESKKAIFDLLAVSYGDNGVPAERLSETYTVRLSKTQYQNALSKGMVYDFTFPAKEPGAYQMRVAVRDRASDKIGSASQFVEVPNLKNKRLSVSGVALENIPYEIWQKRADGSSGATERSDPLTDTSLRRFKRGTVLNYGFTIYNPRPGPGNTYDLRSQIRLFNEGKKIFQGSPQEMPAGLARHQGSVEYAGSLSLATDMAAGDYVLEIVVTDRSANEAEGTISQFVEFEIVD